MALLFNEIQQTAQTHIFIVGVGGYPYLEGGTQEKVQMLDGAKQLKQLSSPQVSVEAFYNTVMDLHNAQAWMKPLGSIELLLSPAPGGKQVFGDAAQQPATIANIKAAYWNWKARCDTDAGNIAIFFFCGHGLDKGEHYLLAEDFGEVPGNPWDATFAFDQTRRAFFNCKASTQLFFVDACRQVTADMLLIDLPINPIEPPNILSKECKFNLTQKAAAANESAYGKKDEPSFYTKALTGALKGNASNNDAGEWRIATGTLSSKMNTYLQDESPDEGYSQRCVSTNNGDTDILRFDSAPVVSLKVTCDPAAALQQAELYCIDPATDIGPTRPPDVHPWQLDISAGIYKIGANFNGPLFKQHQVFAYVKPPKFIQTLNCMP
jgi:Caspase domain